MKRVLKLTVLLMFMGYVGAAALPNKSITDVGEDVLENGRVVRAARKTDVTLGQCKKLAAVSRLYESGQLGIRSRRAYLASSLPPYTVVWVLLLHSCIGAPYATIFYVVLAVIVTLAFGFALAAQLAVPSTIISQLNVKDKTVYESIVKTCDEWYKVEFASISSPSKLLQQSHRAWFATVLAGITMVVLIVAAIALVLRRVTRRGGSDEVEEAGRDVSRAPSLNMMKLSFESARTRLAAQFGVCIEDDNETCVICFGELSGGGALILDCKHRFHTACIARWLTLAYNIRCPVCREYIEGLETVE